MEKEPVYIQPEVAFEYKERIGKLLARKTLDGFAILSDWLRACSDD